MFTIMDDTWKRKDYYKHYMDHLRCTYSVTVDVDVRNVLSYKDRNCLKFYPVLVYLLAKVVNEMDEFRMGFSETGEVGRWDVLHPTYSVLNQRDKNFFVLWAPYGNGFSRFYKTCIKDMKTYKNAETILPQEDIPENTFTISSVPWLDFTAFNLNVFNEGNHLSPIFTTGKIKEDNTMPLAIQVHHAVCDGYHVGQFVERFRELAAAPEVYLD